MEKITVNVEFLFELTSNRQWINKVPDILPNKLLPGESWIWVSPDGYVFNKGSDFSVAEKLNKYPCKVYRLVSVDRLESPTKIEN